MDLTESIAPRSDQVNADDLVGGPITYTIREVVGGKAEAPFDFMLVETDRAYRPSKTMRRVIVNAWGAEAANYAGRRLTLYREPTIKFGGAVVGGIRISHMSHIDKACDVMLQVTRGKRERFVVQPLPDAPAPEPIPTEADVQASTDTDLLRSWWKHAHLQGAIKARVDELKAERDANAEPVEPGLFEGGQA
jgi:hypothetical protein